MSFGGRWNRLAASEKFRDWASVAFIFALAATMLSPILRGDWPVGHDHPVHLFRIWQLREQLLHHGTPWGWSHRWFAGYPLSVIYPMGTDLFVLAVQALSFGLLKLGNAYGVAFLLFYFLYGYGTYFFVRRAIGSQIAGLIAVVFLLTEPGNVETGGWFWIVDVGVWAAPFGSVPALIATVQIAALMEKPNAKTAAGIALCIGLALLWHPLHMIYFALAIPLLCLSRYLTGIPTRWTRFFSFIDIAILVGVLIASFWLVPYFVALPYAGEIGVSGTTLKKIGGDFMAGHLFERMHAIPIGLGIVGVICLLWARQTLTLFMGLFVFVIIVLSSSTFPSLFGSSVQGWFESYIISPRMLMLAKPFWFGAVGYGVVTIWRASRLRIGTGDPAETSSKRATLVRRTIMAVVLLVFVAPVLFYSLASFWKWEVRRPSIWHSQRPDQAARRDLLTWAKTELDRPNEFFRIAHGLEPNEHDFADLAIDLPYPFYEAGHTPTGHFKWNVASSSPITLHTLNVRFVLSHKPLSRDDFRLVKNFRDQIWLYEVRNWSATPFEIRGTGTVELLKFDQEEIILRAGEGASGNLRLNVSEYPNWRAERDGSAIPIESARVPWIQHAMFMQVPLAPGTYRFHYDHGFAGKIGAILSIAGLIACVLLARSSRVASWLSRTGNGDEPVAN
jgi:hypothetical protein